MEQLMLGINRKILFFFSEIIIDLFSTIRLVPNNQEVFMHAESDQSIIVEILERVDEVSDENAIK
jgi:hypothetical protein